jgi:diacylglycerol kinase (ATP)
MRRGSATEQEVRVVYNPASGGAAGHTARDLRRELRDLRPELVVTGDKGDAYVAARSWRRGLIVAAGGDGTVNEVVNGLGGAGFPEGVTLAVLPLGTGNDLAATLGIPACPKKAVPILLQGITRKLDAARLRSEEGESFFANVAAGGLGAEVSAAADDKETKRRWGRVSYLRASLAALRDRTAHRLRIELDGTRHDLEALNVTVGNCRYAGGGWPAAPGANPEDGLLDVVVLKDGGTTDLLLLAPRALADRDYTRSRSVFAARARSMRVKSEPDLGFTADGELISKTPVEFAVLPRSLHVIVGPEYTPEASPRARSE